MLELRPVRLGAKAGDVVAHVTGMLAERIGARTIVRRLHRVEPGLHRRLGVNDDRTPAGKLNREIRPEGSIAGSPALEDIVHMLVHPRQLADAAQLHLAPFPSDHRGPQRVDQVLRPRAEVSMGVGESRQLPEEGIGARRLCPALLGEPALGLQLGAQGGHDRITP
ncbi:MAG: hypothetical protein IPK85_20245 [Gemmatimonadetes bacterium]|nr:hypothetical protein [Gemmatimonadota bacterium]